MCIREGFLRTRVDSAFVPAYFSVAKGEGRFLPGDFLKMLARSATALIRVVAWGSNQGAAFSGEAVRLGYNGFSWRASNQDFWQFQ